MLLFLYNVWFFFQTKDADMNSHFVGLPFFIVFFWLCFYFTSVLWCLIMSFHPTNGARSGGMFINFSQPVFVEFYSSNTELNVETTCEIYDNFLIVLFAWSEIGVAKMVLIFLSYFCVLLGVPCDLSIGSTETKYIKLNTKTQFFFNNIQLLYIL